MTCPLRCGAESENNDLGCTPYGDGLAQASHLLPLRAENDDSAVNDDTIAAHAV